MEHQESLFGKTIVVTGATAGIGLVTARELARMGATVVIVSRNPEKCAAIAAQIQQETGNPAIDYFAADLSSQKEIHQLVDRFRAKYNSLNILVNNAGAIFTRRHLSMDGIEMTLALNHLSYFLLTNLLLDLLIFSAPARIVNVSSNAHFNSGIDFADLQLETKYAPFKAYGRSKFANVLFTYELSRRLEGSDVTANVLHPGLVQTDIGKNASWWLGVAWRIFTPLRQGLTPEQGAQTSIYLASSPNVNGLSGKYFVRKQEHSSDPETYDTEAAQRLWEMSSRLVELA